MNKDYVIEGIVAIVHEVQFAAIFSLVIFYRKAIGSSGKGGTKDSFISYVGSKD